MVERDVVLAKVAIVDRCLSRISDVRGRAESGALTPIDVEDIVVVNLQRAVQAAIDLAAHVVANEGYGLPDRLGETFSLLEKNGIIEAELCSRLRKMVGFRNIAVHQYQALEPEIVDAIVRQRLGDLEEFVARILQRFSIDA